MKTPHYRRNYKTGHETQSAYDLLTIIILAGLRALAEDGDYKTFGDVHHEKRWLMNENGLAHRYNPETGETEVYMPGDDLHDEGAA